MPRLKHAQHWILENILSKVAVKEEAHGFIKGKSIVTNASLHTGRDVVVNIDLKDFFPTLSYKRVKGMFRSFGYSEHISIILALLSTEPEADEVVLDEKTYFVAKTDRFLPQGAPTSPMITNIIAKRLDARLAGAARVYGYTYSRYADDMTFSSTDNSQWSLGQLLWFIRKVIVEEGFTLHPDKVRIMHKSRHQEVTGITVNSKAGISRKKIKQFRALLFQIEKDGIEGKKWGTSDNLLAAIHGFSSYLYMVDPVRYQPYIDRVKAIISAHNFKHTRVHYPGQNRDFYSSYQPKSKNKFTLPEFTLPENTREKLKLEQFVQQKPNETTQQAQQRAAAVSSQPVSTTHMQAQDPAHTKKQNNRIYTIIIVVMNLLFALCLFCIGLTMIV
ncbi:MAG: reverse transcriptase family protein [Candidatus Dojkabacteria bacterium]